MRKRLTALFSVVALLFALTPAFAQQGGDLQKFAGTYEFDVPDFGLITVFVEVTEENTLTLSAMDQPPSELKQLDANRFELDSPEMGIIAIGFIENEDGEVTQMTIDSFEFSFVAEKKGGK